MTADGGMRPGTYRDEARIGDAWGRVANYFNLKAGADFSLEELQALKNYDQIPAPARATLEELTIDERQLLKKIFTTLGDNYVYLENSQGWPWPPFY
jgi:hypothetical protein